MPKPSAAAAAPAPAVTPAAALPRAPATPAGHVRLGLERKGAPRRNLSACVLAGPCLWLASDETARIERLVARDGAGRDYAGHRSFTLDGIFDLPDGPEEMDIEGLSTDGGWLWITGSHSLKREKPEMAEHGPKEALERLTDVTCPANRFFLGRAPLAPGGEDGVPDLVREAAGGLGGDAGRRAAGCLRMRKGRNALAEALRKDEHLARFMAMPAKENGFDIEGLAVRGERVFLGLRGPVLRGWATILELAVRGSKRADGRLKLRRIGPDGARYRKHFLDLDGLGVRELELDGEDLLVLAGPTMDLDGPVALFRWPGALKAERQTGLVTRDRLRRVLDLPFGTGCDHPEGIALRRDGAAAGRPAELLVVHDSPAPERFEEAGGGLRADLFTLPPA